MAEHKKVKFFNTDTFKSWEVREEGDDEKSFNRWTNKDVIPVPKHQRNYTTWAFTGYWIAAGFNTTAWSLGSSNIANGLNAGQTIGGVFLGAWIAGLVAFVCGEPGVLYHLGFPMMSRSTFGMYGAWFVIMIKCFVNFIFCGVQCYWGGLAVRVILGSIFPSFLNMANTLPESAAINTQQLVGFIIYIAIFVPLMFVHPSKLQPILVVAFIGVAATIIGLFGWAVGSNGGAGTVIASSKIIDQAEGSFRMLQACSAVAGSWTGSSIRQSDWTRFAKTKRSPVLNQLIGAPATITIAAAFGVFATSAVKSKFGVTVWNPIELLQWILANQYTPAARAGCFFGGCGFFLSQLSVNLVQNSVSAGMDLASLAPKYIDTTRGALIMIVVGVVINPWRFVNTPSSFITVLSSFGMFVSPLAGVNVADFWLVRRLRWKVPDLYIGNSSSIYWYTAGLNWRAFLSWTLTIWPSIPGFAYATAGTNVSLGWQRVFQVTWFVGFLGGGLVYYLICLVFPPAGAPYEKVYGMYGNAEIDTEEVLVGEGQSDIEKGSSVEENTGHVKIKVDGKADL